ncbi:orange domain-containing protein [Trichonephila clavata]|uniref:Orange domain-containing protein n=1 Tax=Trichonephila clavata TaxID=2740835 RepID=A0A8X6FBX0_TRICU|nr:orange domain-containing protein [Trichonephila clavata]
MIFDIDMSKNNVYELNILLKTLFDAKSYLSIGYRIMPNIPEHSEEYDLEASAAEEDKFTELFLTGFQACAKEALRFLLEDEGLSPEHPLPSGLNEHLVRQQCHLAEALQNDSGVDLEESFLTLTTDGSTTAESLSNHIMNSSELAAGFAETILQQVMHDSFLKEITQRTLMCENEASENYCRTEILNSNKNISKCKDNMNSEKATR